MGTELCNCQNFFQKTENESNLLSNSKNKFSTIDKKDSIDKRLEEESSTADKYYKLKFGDKNSDTIDKPTNIIENPKKKGIFDINNSFEKENKENENKINENVEKNQKESNVSNPKNQVNKTFTFKDVYNKSNGENNNTDHNNKMNNLKNNSKKNILKEEINVKNKINEEEDEYIKSANDMNTKNTKNSKLTNIQNNTNNEKENKEKSNEKEMKDNNNNIDNKPIEEPKKIEVKESQKITTEFLSDFLLGGIANNEEEEKNDNNKEENENENNNASNDNLDYESNNSDYMYNNNNKEEGSHSSLFD